LTINEYTGIDTRSAIGTIDHPIVNGPEPPSIAELCELFLDHGVKLSIEACRKALKQWGGDPAEITHVVATTCTNSANPGFDHFVVKGLGLNQSVEKVLLHGVGCSGGLGALRTAANIALGSSYRRKPARILVLACEISSILVRSELESVHKDQDTRIGLALFSDCASAVVLGNGYSDRFDEEPILELLGWEHKIIEDTEKDLGFDVDPVGRLARYVLVDMQLTLSRLESRFDTTSSQIDSSCRARHV
jgi:fungal type III polyketide synthase